MPKFKVGDHVTSQSGKVYKITAVYPLDDHGSFGYAIKGWRGGHWYGPTRRMAECDLHISIPIEEQSNA